MTTGTFNDWHVYVRDTNLLRLGEIDDFTNLQLTPVFNDVGSWQMTISAESDSAGKLASPGYGIVVVRDGVTIFSGPIANFTYQVDESDNVLNVSGYDDNLLLKDRNATPQPLSSAPPYNTNEYDTHTGACSTVLIAYVNENIGPSAIAPRKRAGLTMGTDPAVGASVTGNSRFDNLLTFLQTLAITGNVGFRVIQVGNGLQFQVYNPVDRSKSVAFSTALGNLTAFTYGTTRPTGNYVFVGGDGDSTARAVNEFANSPSISQWGRIEGDFVNSSGTSGSAQMSQDGQAALVSGDEQMQLTITPVDTPQCLYKVNYDLGDTVSVVLSKPIRTPYGIQGKVIDTVQSCTIALTSGGGVITSPVVSPVPRNMRATLFRDLKQFRKRLNLLERH